MALHINDPLPLFINSRVLIPVVGFSLASHRYSHPRPKYLIMSPSEKNFEELAGRKLPEETKPVPDA